MKKTKKLVSILLLVVIIATLCTMFVGCGNKNQPRVYKFNLNLNEPAKTFNVIKGKIHEFKLAVHADGEHELFGELSAGTATIEIQQKGPNIYDAWETTRTVYFTKGKNTCLVNIGTSKLNLEDSKIIGNTCRARISFSKNAKFSFGWCEHADLKITDLNKHCGIWKSASVPKGDNEFFQYKTILYLNPKYSNMLGEVLDKASVRDAIKIFMNQKQINENDREMLFKSLNKIISNVNGTQNARLKIVNLLCGALEYLFSAIVNHARFYIQIKQVAKTLINAKTAQRIAFSVGTGINPLCQGYQIETSNVIGANGHWLLGALRHKGEFKLYKI